MHFRLRLSILAAVALAGAAVAWAADPPSTKAADAAPSLNVPTVNLPDAGAADAAAAKPASKASAKGKAEKAASKGKAAAETTDAVVTAKAAEPRAPEAMPAVMPTVGATAPAAPAAAAGPVAVASPIGAASAPTAAAAASAPAEAASAAMAAASAPTGPLDTRIQDTKADVIQLNRDLLVLEEELLFPANTQVALFVSMDVGKMFSLDSVQVKLDDKLVANYLYTPLEVQALHRGGVQRVYLGNLKTGPHELVAFFTGQGPHQRDYKRGATVKFEKGTEAKYIELRIRDSGGRLQPEFDVKTWQ